MSRVRGPNFLIVGVILALLGGACTSGKPVKKPGTAALIKASTACGTKSGTGCAPVARRIDLHKPTFSDPTNITNPLFPISNLKQVLMLGAADGKPFRSEVTLLPDTKTIEWDGMRVETLVSQYTAYSGGRIVEVALDWYAQADDGSVWYFGEDVFNYSNGAVADTEGTWIAGKDGPAAMIMPAKPKAGDVYRPENSVGIVFEEVTVISVGETVAGPNGPVNGAIKVRELHMDGATEDKTFAPGYGEFFTGGGGDLEAVALGVPVDAVGSTMPSELAALSSDAFGIFDAASAENWADASIRLASMTTAWDSYKAGGVPRALGTHIADAVRALADAVNKQKQATAPQAALYAAQAALDLQLRHRPSTEVDRARSELWARQVLVDVATKEAGDVAGDVTTLEWIWDRFAHTVAGSTAGEIGSHLKALRAAVATKDLAAAARTAETLRATIAALS